MMVDDDLAENIQENIKYSPKNDSCDLIPLKYIFFLDGSRNLQTIQNVKAEIHAAIDEAIPETIDYVLRNFVH